MAKGVFRDVKISWQGKDHVFTPSNRLLRLIESDGVSLVETMVAAEKGRPLIGNLALILSRCLGAAGVTVSEDEALAEMVGEDAKETVLMARSLLTAIFPSVDVAEPEKAPPPKQRTAPSGAKARRP